MLWRRDRAHIAIVVVAVIAAGQSRAQLSGETTQLTTNPAPQFDPAISGDLVVFTDQRNGNEDVYFYNIASGVETQVTTSTAPQRLHDVDANTIVFTDLSAPGAHVVAYDVVSGTTTNVTPGPGDQNPRIEAQYVVFQRGATNVDVYAVDLTTGAEIVIAATSAIELNPSVSGTLVVYERKATATSPADIVLYDIATGSETVIAGSALDERRPDIDGNIVVWDVAVAAGDSDIAIHDLATGLSRTLVIAGEQRIPHVSGRIVAFDDTSKGNPDVALHHVDLNITIAVAAEAASEFLNDIDGNRVVYTSNAAGNLDIWLFEFTLEPPTCEVSDDICSDTTGFSSELEATLTRASGTPVDETYTFAAKPGPGTIVIHNNGCSSARGTLNGIDLALQSDLNPNVTCFARDVQLEAVNTLVVELRSGPGCSIDVSVLVRDECLEPDVEPASSCAGMNPSASGLFGLVLLGMFRRRR